MFYNNGRETGFLSRENGCIGRETGFVEFKAKNKVCETDSLGRKTGCVSSMVDAVLEA